MHGITFLHDLAIVMIVAGLVTVVFHRLKQPVVLGYIIAGVIVGPHTPPFPLISDEETIRTLSELGVVLLMFSLGLEFSLRKLRAVGATALIAALAEIFLMTFAGYEIGRAFGWRQMDCIFLGAIISISSTAIIVKALEDSGKTKEKFASLIIGILIVEDILAIIMIALLSGFATTGSFTAHDIGLTVLKLGSFLVILLVVGLIVVPRLLEYVARFRSNEMLLITVLALCFGVSLLAVKLNYSVALGAFLIGAIVAEARQIRRIEILVQPIRDMFSAVFFVSIGLLINPALIREHLGPILIISGVVIVGQVMSYTFGAFAAGNDMRTSMRVGMGLAQIGEFSFIIASLGLSLKVTSEFLYPIAVAVSVLTTLTTPYLIRSADSMVAGFDRFAPRTLQNYLKFYTRWVSRLGRVSHENMAFTFVKKLTWQIAFNVVLVIAIFVGAAVSRDSLKAAWPNAPGGINGLKGMLWAATVFVSLPILITIFRKTQALAMLLSEVSIRRTEAGERTSVLRALLYNTLLTLATLALVALILLLSSTILPSWNVAVILIALLILAVPLLRRSATRVYASAQVALRETLAQTADPAEPTAPKQASMLSAATLRSVRLVEDSFGVGKRLDELELRTRTGASVVGIERNGTNIVNPGPEEDLRSGDTILLLGSGEHLDAAAKVLTERGVSPQ